MESIKLSQRSCNWGGFCGSELFGITFYISGGGGGFVYLLAYFSFQFFWFVSIVFPNICFSYHFKQKKKKIVEGGFYNFFEKFFLVQT